MPQDPFAQFVDKSDPFAAFVDAPSRTKSVITGAKQGVGDLKDSAIASLKMIGELVQPGGLKPTMRGMVEPFLTSEGRKGAAESLKPDLSDPLRSGTRAAVNVLGMMAGPKIPKIARGLATAEAAPAKVATAGARLAPKATGPSIEQVMADALEELRTSKPTKISGPTQNAQPSVSYPKVKAPEVKVGRENTPSISRPKRPAGDLSGIKLPKAWEQFVDKAETSKIEALPKEPPMWSKPPRDAKAVRDLRGAVGADEAGAILGTSADDVRAAGGPKRRPIVADVADLDHAFLRQINNPRGGVDPKLLMKSGAVAGGGLAGAELAQDGKELPGGILGALAALAAVNPVKAAKGAQTARVTAMLSGMAVPKSVAGNTGAFLTSAIEQGSLAPIKEALRLPTNAKNAIQGFRHGANPSATEGMGKLNLPGRVMGALDDASTKALMRGGETLEGAQRLLLTAPAPLGVSPLQKALHTPLGRFLVPFQRTPFNGIKEGINSVNDLLPGSGASNTKRALTVGAGAAGAAAGSETENPMILALLAALAGPRALPFAAGAGLTAGPRVIERVGVGLPDASLRDVIDPLRPIDQPALLRLLRELGAQ